MCGYLGYIERGLFQYKFVEDLLNGDWNSPDLITKIWLLLCIELWFRTFVDGEAKGVVNIR